VGRRRLANLGEGAGFGIGFKVWIKDLEFRIPGVRFRIHG
jgi:hypothetical protein